MSPRKRAIDSELGRLAFWGSECTDCGNATPGTMRCDQCQNALFTAALWMEAKS